MAHPHKSHFGRNSTKVTTLNNGRTSIDGNDENNEMNKGNLSSRFRFCGFTLFLNSWEKVWIYTSSCLLL